MLYKRRAQRKVCNLNGKTPFLVPRLQEVRIIFSPLWRNFWAKEKVYIYCYTALKSELISYCSCNKFPQNYQFKIIKIIILQFWRLEVQSEPHWAKLKVLTFWEDKAGNMFPCLFRLLEACRFAYFMSLFSHLQSQQHQTKSFSCGHLSGSLFQFHLPLLGHL